MLLKNMNTWRFFADHLGKRYVFFVAITANLMFLYSGISLAWPSPVLIKLNGTEGNPMGNPITSEQNDLLGSVFSIGAAVGPAIFIYIIEVFGQKFAMTIIAACFPLFYFILAFSKNIYLYYVNRISLGIAVGACYSTVVVYIGEVVPAEMRGTYSSLGVSFLLLGCLISYSVGPYISVFAFNLFIAILSLIYLPLIIILCPESLYSEMRKNGSKSTLELLKKLRNNDQEYVELEIIEHTIKHEEQSTWLDIFRSRAGRKAFIISSTLLIFQQLCGVTVVTTYTQQIFEKADVPIASDVCVIIFSVFQAITCFIIPLTSKFVNARTMLKLSLLGSFLSHSVLGLYFYVDFLRQYHWIPLVSLIFFALFGNCGIGPLPWVYLGELYPSNMKSLGTAISSLLYWLCQFAVTYLYDKFEEGTSFFIFAVACLFGICFVQFFVIETRGKSLQEIQKCLEK
ncbi:hypothetical protein WA026_000027 [Henosepilachna vigintioctopunctata]|uniref:Major facilitator superfamily (MFS) profile domain-containing protein n=1 Tax=Henosepilachna vigintioctopunctata TaxID=420089 RepID=A0AAW1V3U6_9CUCU